MSFETHGIDSELLAGGSRPGTSYSSAYRSPEDPTSSRQLASWDAVQNWRYAKANKRFLVVRQWENKPFFYDLLLNWLECYYPKIRELFELQSLPCRVRDFAPYALCIPWLQDPVQDWSVTAFDQACELQQDCDGQQIPIINRVERLVNAGKSAGARLMGSAGIRTARIEAIADKEEFKQTRYGMGYPLLIREDWGHGGKIIRVNGPHRLSKVRIGQFTRPIAVEFVDVKNPADGLYRKYRYVLAGDLGISLSLHACTGWQAKGTQAVYSEALRNEEITFCQAPNPHHDLFVQARLTLGLDFVAFDYSYCPAGDLIIWEANPYPRLHFPDGRRAYRRAGTHRVLAAMVRLYLTRAGLHVPEEIEALGTGRKDLYLEKYELPYGDVDGSLDCPSF